MLLHQKQDQVPIIYSLRGLAACMVAFLHFSNWTDIDVSLFDKSNWIRHIGFHGGMGVYIFFVISGFVIPYSLIKSKYQIRNFFRFILKRSIRIEIPYIVSIFLFVVLAVIYHFMFGLPCNCRPEKILLHFFYLIPFTKYDWITIIYWTLGVEFQFYLVIAIFIYFFTHRNKFVQTLSLLGFIGINLFNHIYPDRAFIYGYSGIFSIGIVTCLFYLKRINTFQFLLILIAGITVVWFEKGSEISIFAISTAMIIYFVNFESKVGFFFGKISYSLYLTHPVIGNNFIYFSMIVWELNIYPPFIFIIAFVLSVFFAWIIWYFVERPSKIWSSRIKLNGT